MGETFVCFCLHNSIAVGAPTTLIINILITECHVVWFLTLHHHCFMCLFRHPLG
jgi:hypothetical protein